ALAGISHTRTVPSALDVASRLPSGANARLLAHSSWPANWHRSLPVATSQRRIAHSHNPVDASHCPSALNAMTPTGPVWPTNSRNGLPVCTSQRRIALSYSPPAARALPSGVNATVPTPLAISATILSVGKPLPSRWTRSPVAVSATDTVPPEFTQASSLPFGEKTTGDTTPAVFTSMRLSPWPAWASYRHSARSLRTTATALPSGVNAAS